MRLRLTALASLLAALTAIVLSGAANAAPRHNDGLTINAIPSRIISGEGVIIYGRLQGTNAAHQPIRLYHRINPRPGYTLIGATTTDANGFYTFTRAEGVVLTNRSWFVRGPAHTHSRTVEERVSALVSLVAQSDQVDTLHPAVFTGHVDPGHRFERVVLQERKNAGDDWHNIAAGFTDRNSDYRIAYRWRLPGLHEVRSVFPGDRRNVRSVSDPASESVEQAQAPGFTITSSAPVINYGSVTAISGVLSRSGGGPDAGVPVTLLSRPVGSDGYIAVATTTTGSDGSYRFSQAATRNTLYVVRVTLTPSRHSAVVFEGVRSVISAAPSATSGQSGSTLTFTGTVLPGTAGGVVYLQRLGKDGDWHSVAVTFTNRVSAYRLSTVLGDPGTAIFRTRVLADGLNVAGVSPRMTVSVMPPTSPASLPPAS